MTDPGYTRATAPVFKEGDGAVDFTEYVYANRNNEVTVVLVEDKRVNEDIVYTMTVVEARDYANKLLNAAEEAANSAKFRAELAEAAAVERENAEQAERDNRAALLWHKPKQA